MKNSNSTEITFISKTFFRFEQIILFLLHYFLKFKNKTSFLIIIFAFQIIEKVSNLISFILTNIYLNFQISKFVTKCYFSSKCLFVSIAKMNCHAQSFNFDQNMILKILIVFITRAKSKNAKNVFIVSMIIAIFIMTIFYVFAKNHLDV